MAAGRPTTRSSHEPAQVMSAMETDVPTCRADAPVADAIKALDEHPGWEQCIVVNDEDVVLGVVPRSKDASPQPVSEVMRHGPATVRPDVERDETLDRMRERKVRERIVTDPTGRLLGVLRLAAG
jgi:CBS domain-containing protein